MNKVLLLELSVLLQVWIWKKVVMVVSFVIFSFAISLGQLSLSFDIDEPSCYNLPNGNVKANPSGGILPYTYNWNTGYTNSHLTGISSNTYSVTVSDATGNSITQSVFVGQPPLILLDFDENICQSPFMLSGVASGGVPPYHYNWSTGASTATIFNLSSGNYRLTLSDSVGCGRVESIDLSSNSLTTEMVSIPLSCFSENDGLARVIVSNGMPGYTYAWSNGGNTHTISNLPQGIYTVTVIDATGCQIVSSVEVESPEELLVEVISQNINCNDQGNSSATANVTGGMPIYSYIWSNGENTASINNLSEGSYFVTVIDSNGCSATDSTVILQSSNFTLTIESQHVNCFEASDGTANVTPNDSSSSYTYFWSTFEFTPAIENLDIGTYFVTVTNTAGCLAVDSVVITQPMPLLLQISGEDLHCFAIPDGTANVIATGGTPAYEYIWSNGENTSSIDMLLPNNYSVTVTDTHDCIAETNIVITQPSPLSLSINTTDETCPNCHDGTATADISGGKPPYLYLWSTDETTASVTNLAPETYTVIVTDANGCTITAAATINAAFLNPAPTTQQRLESKNTNTITNTVESDNPTDKNTLVSVYPNPVSTELSLVFEKNTYKNIQIKIVSLTGITFLSQQITNPKRHTINMRNMPTGSYFLRLIYDEKYVEVMKIIKK